MSRDVATASRHAVDRYRQHYPSAYPHDLLAAVALAMPIPLASARALVGRGLLVAGASTDEYRLHLDGGGIFVLCPLMDDSNRSFVRTYLRLDSMEQRRMARAWFLDPLPILRQAFELGFEAARGPAAPPLAMQASAAHLAVLAALAPRLACPAPVTSHPPEIQTTGPTALPKGAPPLPSIAPGPRPPATAASVSLSGAPCRVLPTLSAAVQENLAWFAQTHAGFVDDLTRWQALSAAGVAVVRSLCHVRTVDICEGLLEPRALAVALLASGSDGVEVRTLINVPRKHRSALLAHAEPGEPHVTRAPSAGPSASTGATLLGPAVEVVERLKVSNWSHVAHREADACGLGFIPPAYLDDLEWVPSLDVPELAERAGWHLQAGGRYALLRHGDFVLLLRQSTGAPAATVVRCACLSGEIGVT